MHMSTLWTPRLGPGVLGWVQILIKIIHISFSLSNFYIYTSNNYSDFPSLVDSTVSPKQVHSIVLGSLWVGLGELTPSPIWDYCR